MSNNSLPHSDKKLLIIDDDKFFCQSIKDDLQNEFAEVVVSHRVTDAEKLCSQTGFDVVLLDNNLPDGSGLSLIPLILRVKENAKIILVTAFPNFENAVEALKKGAFDYVSKPIEIEELRVTIERALESSALEAVKEVSQYRTDRERRKTAIIGRGEQHQEIQELVNRAASTNASVLITGETGTGKNVAAKAIHFQSANSDSPFISVNCAALPENLIEAELFGVEKGAYTGAVQSRKGTFELADGGTLFLDEIGEMPTALQAKLLSALEERRIKRIGGTTERSVKVRVIAATNAEPERAIAGNRLRADLYYRLSVLRIHLVPLRERTADIPILCQHFIEQFSFGRDITLPAGEIELLQKYSFPGNVRELRNIIERCVILQEGNYIYPSKIIAATPNEQPQQLAENENSAEIIKLADVEKNHILNSYQKLNCNIARTADALDISLSTLKRKLREYGVR
jgi:DNA-binding NtrC family response regulator